MQHTNLESQRLNATKNDVHLESAALPLSPEQTTLINLRSRLMTGHFNDIALLTNVLLKELDSPYVAHLDLRSEIVMYRTLALMGLHAPQEAVATVLATTSWGSSADYTSRSSLVAHMLSGAEILWSEGYYKNCRETLDRVEPLLSKLVSEFPDLREVLSRQPHEIALQLGEYVDSRHVSPVSQLGEQVLFSHLSRYFLLCSWEEMTRGLHERAEINRKLGGIFNFYGKCHHCDQKEFLLLELELAAALGDDTRVTTLTEKLHHYYNQPTLHASDLILALISQHGLTHPHGELRYLMPMRSMDAFHLVDQLQAGTSPWKDFMSAEVVLLAVQEHLHGTKPTSTTTGLHMIQLCNRIISLFEGHNRPYHPYVRAMLGLKTSLLKKIGDVEGAEKISTRFDLLSQRVKTLNGEDYGCDVPT